MPPQQYPAPDYNREVPSWEELRQRAIDILRSGPARGWQPTDWEDMAQEAVLKTIVALANPDQVDRQRFDPWFYTVVVHVARDWYRRYGRDVPLPEAHEPEDTRVNAELEQLLAGHDVEVLLTSLQPQERLVLKLIYWHDLTSREIAAVFGETVPAATVRAWSSRALQKLRVSLRRT
jgi:RNA polymerase sigma-70 factor (ECF subfamily)